MSDIRTLTKLDGDDIIVKRTQDCEPIIEANRSIQNEPQKRAGTFRHIASVPMVVLEQWIIADGVNYLALPKGEFERLIKRKLRDPDFKWLRTSPGRV